MPFLVRSGLKGRHRAGLYGRANYRVGFIDKLVPLPTVLFRIRMEKVLKISKRSIDFPAPGVEESRGL